MPGLAAGHKRSRTTPRSSLVRLATRVRGYEHGPRAFGRTVLRQHTKAPGHLLVGLQDAAEVAAEAVLVELVAALHVPQAAAVGADLVGEHDAHLLVVVPQAAELDLEVDEADA